MRKKMISDVMAEMGKRRGRKLSLKKRRQIAAKGGRASWIGMTAEERRVEMRRRLGRRKKK